MNQEHGFTVDEDPGVAEGNDSFVDHEVNAVQRENRKTRRNKNPAKERISRLINDNHAKDQINMQLQAELAEKEHLLSVREHELRSKELNNQQLFETNLKAEEYSIIQGLRSAKEEGDIDREIELQRDLARVKGEQTTFDVLKIQQQYQDPATHDEEDTSFYPSVNPYAYEADHYQEAPELPDEFVDFIERNPWVNPNAREFSPELAQEADALATEFTKRLKFNNQAHLVGGDEYFAEIENIMRDNYSLGGQQQQRSQPQQRSYQNAPVSGVSRQGASMADQYMSRNNSIHRKDAITLTPAEYKIARNLQVPDPRQPGKYLSHDEVVRTYAEAKQQYSRQPADSRYRVSID